ncbi:16_t:CDS:2, partial [Scutellospora calospora]
MPNTLFFLNSTAGPRSLTSTATQTPPSASGPHSAFTPYNQAPQHPTPVTTPTTTKNSIPQEASAMMTTHLENNTSTMIYPQHHFANPTTHPFWPSYFGGGNPANGAAVLSANGGSAFVPAVGYGSAGSGMAQGHTPRPKLTTTIWEDEGTLCYQVDARDNDMINGTKLLNVVGMSRGKRDGILKNEKGRVVVKVGAMHLKGVWITFQRAKTLAAQFKISELLYPLFVDDPSIFLHNSYGPSMSTRIPSIGNGPQSQWRPTHPYANNFNNTPYSTDATRQWYPYGNGNQIMGNPNVPQGQDHGSSPYPPATGYAERPQHVANPPAVPIYSAQPPRNHSHPQTHLEDYDAGYSLINGQPQGQQGVSVVPGPASEENPGNNGYMRSNNQGLYNIVSATDVPMNVSSNSSPNNSAFSGWNHSGKRVKYEFPEATTPSSSQSSPRISTAGYQLPGLGAGTATPGANPSTPQGYPNSNLQMNTVLHTPSPDGTPVEESNSIGRRYDQYRQREDHTSTEEISNS